ncbi:PREDICTED: uncharacterized protein LOC109475063 [Branchiostoma belcheri]|uniref:Uncharacterized protein LOC109475063 n=1 Tax=Branchiostoma belcheri TaxID=7741 RepID=A0A6P4ZJA0_BRABE|nr:PREDICTED: uncharacterized protein LOC109475063 [Branchiostoma belcheri]
MKLSVCLLFLGCLVIVAESMSEPREEDLQGLLTELEDLVDELEVAEVRMEKRESYEECKSKCEAAEGKSQLQKDVCKINCDYEHGKFGKREKLEAEKEVGEIEKRVSGKCSDYCSVPRIEFYNRTACEKHCEESMKRGEVEELKDTEEELQEETFSA